MRNNYFGILITVVITAGALAFVTSTLTPTEGSIQQQGENVIERTASELTEIPETITGAVIDTSEIIDELADETDNNISDFEDTSETFSETITETPEIFDDIAKEVDQRLLEIPNVVEKSIGNENTIRIVSINSGSSFNNCGDVECISPVDVRIESGGEVIWTNNDDKAHTINHGTPSSGTTGLFESDLVYPTQSYSISLNTIGEYDYFCELHPWLKGKISVYPS